MKRTIVLLITILFSAAAFPLAASVLVEDEFPDGAGTPPDAARFEWAGEVAQNGSGQVSLQTWTSNHAWLRSRSGAAPGPGETLVLQMRAYAYAEGWNPGVYGNKQPRGLRVGTDANNAVEFYSLSRTSLGLRLRKDGVESLGSYALPSGVDSMHDYEISVTTTSVCFKVDGAVAGTFAANIPAGVLNVYVSSDDGGGVGNVPVSVESLSLSLTGQPPSPPAISSFSPTRGPAGTSVTINGTNFASVTSVRFNGVEAVFSIASDSQLAATVPASASSGSITVTGPGGAAVSSNSFFVPATVAASDEASLDAALSNNVGEVIFTCDGTIEITATKVISSDLILDAAGHNVTISGSNAVRVLSVNPEVHLTLRNLTIANGNCPTSGAGLENNGGVVMAVDCTFTNNAAAGMIDGGNGSGGALYNYNNGSLLLTNCTIADNRAIGGPGATGSSGGGTGGTGGYGYGGGIGNNGGSIVAVNCTFSGNQAGGGMGGTGGRGVDGYQYWHSVPWPGSGYWVTVPGGPGGRGGNGGNGFGGSLYNTAGTVSLVNVTLARGFSSGGSGGSGGYAGNYASGSYGSGSMGYNSYGGNIGIASGNVTLRNTIIAHGNGTPGGNCAGTPSDYGNNICSDATATFSSSSSLNNTDPLLAAVLGSNGGQVMTIALLSQSPAINSGDDAFAPATDQRHLSRAGLSDIGAYEFQTPASVISYAWLRGFGLATDGSADDTDSDGDGMSNVKEWTAGTHPTNDASCLKMLSPACTESGVAVRWQSVSGKIYSVQRSTDLGGQSFSILRSDIPGQPGTTLYFDTNTVGSGPFFYRVDVQQ